jgi:transposase
MIRRPGRRDKDADGRFAEPPWNQSSPPWQRIDARLPSHHVARQISEIVDQLDLGSLFGSYWGRGSKAHRPDLLLKMVLYEIQCGKPSPAEWHRDLRENEVVKWLVFGIQPCRAAVYEFRDRLADYWDQWNAQVLQMAQQRGVTIGERGALDGSLMAALASRHKLVNQKTLDGRIGELNRVVAADEQGAVSEARAAWMANHPESRAQQRKRYRHAQARMKELQEQNQKRPSSKRKKPEKMRVQHQYRGSLRQSYFRNHENARERKNETRRVVPTARPKGLGAGILSSVSPFRPFVLSRFPCSVATDSKRSSSAWATRRRRSDAISSRYFGHFTIRN